MNAVHIVLSAAWLQDGDTLSGGNNKLLMIFIGIVAFSMLVQAIALIAVAVGAAKARKKVLEIVEELKAKALPIMEKTTPIIHQVGEVVRDISPKIKVISENLVETSHTVRSKAADIDATVTDANRKTRAQVARVDDMVTSVLNRTSAIADSIHHTINVPVREVSGIVQGLKAGLDVLVGRAKSFGGSQRSSVRSSEAGYERGQRSYEETNREMHLPDDRNPGW